MYCHSLKASKGRREYSIQCEDLPVGNGLVGMWLYDMDLDEATCRDLLKGLIEWASASDLKFRIYTTRDAYETNVVD